jgi:hypothetical protein
MYLEQLKMYSTKAEMAGYRTWVLPADEIKPIAEMLCLIDVDEHEREYILQIMYANELSESQGFERKKTDIILLQFTINLPFIVEENCRVDTALLLHFLNIQMPIGQFIFSDLERSIVFRGGLTHVDETIASWLVVEAINMIRFFVGRFREFIEPVASGNTTYSQVMQNLIEQGRRLQENAS